MKKAFGQKEKHLFVLELQISIFHVVLHAIQCFPFLAVHEYAFFVEQKSDCHTFPLPAPGFVVLRDRGARRDETNEKYVFKKNLVV